MPRESRSGAVARLWHGRTRASVADEYAKYLYEEGVKKLRAVKGNRGVQVFRRVHEGIAEFITISYWESRDAIHGYAGADIEKTQHLPKDPEYLLEVEPTVKHFDVVVSEWSGEGAR
jgi:heme-degrading monooxygenase HmoA